MFRKKIPVGRIIPPFFFESSESGRFLNYLHDSNSIFRARRIKSEGVSGGTVKRYYVVGERNLDSDHCEPNTTGPAVLGPTEFR